MFVRRWKVADHKQYTKANTWEGIGMLREKDMFSLSFFTFSSLHFRIFRLKENSFINFTLATPVYIKGNVKVQKQILIQLLSTRPVSYIL